MDLRTTNLNINQEITDRFSLAKKDGLNPDAIRETVRRRIENSPHKPRHYFGCPLEILESYEAALDAERQRVLRAGMCSE